MKSFIKKYWQITYYCDDFIEEWITVGSNATDAIRRLGIINENNALNVAVKELDLSRPCLITTKEH